MPERVAFRMSLDPGEVAVCERRYNEVFPELAKTLRDAEVSDYSILLDPETSHLFATLTRGDHHTEAELPKTEILKRW